MGNISNFSIKDLREEFNLEYFIETGTGKGVSLNYAKMHNFEKIYSIEIEKKLYDNLVSTITDKRIKLFNTTSSEGLKSILSEDLSGNILFWLDAHFPGWDYGLKNMEDSNNNIRIPLEDEINIIKHLRGNKKDVFIIDDLRIYEDGPFANGNWPDRNKFGGDGIKFIESLYNKTHNIIKDYRDEGYIIMKPKK